MSERASISVEIRVSEGGVTIAEVSAFETVAGLGAVEDRLYDVAAYARYQVQGGLEKLMAAEAPPAPEVPAPDEA